MKLFFFFCSLLIRFSLARKCQPGQGIGSDKKTCLPCPKGTFSNEKTTSEHCIDCPLGFASCIGKDCFDPNNSKTGATECTNCKGYAVSKSKNYCELCLNNTHFDSTTHLCETCTSHTYYVPGSCLNPNADFHLRYCVHGSCLNCPPGRYTPSDHHLPSSTSFTDYYSDINDDDQGDIRFIDSKTNPTCPGLCLPGRYRGINDPHCQLCPAGTYASDFGSGKCTPCTARSISREEGSLSCTEVCPLNRVSSTDHTACISCPAGYIVGGFERIRGGNGVDERKEEWMWEGEGGGEQKRIWIELKERINDIEIRIQHLKQLIGEKQNILESNQIQSQEEEEEEEDKNNDNIENNNIQDEIDAHHSLLSQLTSQLLSFYTQQQNICIPCPTGYIAERGVGGGKTGVGGGRGEGEEVPATCQPCAPGWVTRSPGALQCEPACPAGYFPTSVSSVHPVCTPCPKGTYMPEGGGGGLSCLPCVGSEVEGATECKFSFSSSLVLNQNNNDKNNQNLNSNQEDYDIFFTISFVMIISILISFLIFYFCFNKKNNNIDVMYSQLSTEDIQL